MFKAKTLYLFIGLLVPALFISGWIEKKDKILKYELIWSPNTISWSNFTRIENLEDDYVATIDSEIFCPIDIPETDFNIYAYMNPSTSFKLHDSVLSDYTLIHEQYHFNITEYHARLLRRDIIKTGKNNLNDKNFDSLFLKYDHEKNIMQYAYDSITDHSVKHEKQRYWELKLDDLLRQTAYFENPDIYSYYDFEKGDTDYYRQLHKTFNYEILTSYPIKASESKHGESYKIIKKEDELIIQFYKNGKLINGGKFNTAITSIKKNDSLTEIRFFNPNESLNETLPFCIFKRFEETNEKIDTYYNSKEERVSDNNIFQTISQKISNNRYLTTYYNKELINIINKDSVFKKGRMLDSLNRVVKIEFFTLDDIPTLDNYYVSKIEKEYDETHKTVAYREFDEHGDFAKHLSSYNLKYEYDERGNVKALVNYNDNFEIAPNKEGIAIYTYTYNKFDNETSSKQFNKLNKPVRGVNDYFMQVREYDLEERLLYFGQFYPEYVLAFNENKWGASRYTYTKDTVITIENLDVFNEVFNNKNGIAIIEKHLNKAGKLERFIYFDYNRNFAKTTDGIIETRSIYDPVGNLIEESTFDSLGNLRAFELDVAVIRWNYDEKKNKIKTSYYNTSLELADAKQNITFNVFKYNAKNELIERTNYNKKMEPMLLDNYFKSKILYNSKGSDSIVYDFDINNKPLIGVFKTTYTYNKYNNLISKSFYDHNNTLTKSNNGIATIKYVYNNKQENIGYAFFDNLGRRTNNTSGVSSNFQELNEFGFVISNSYFNKNNEPAVGPEGYHRQEFIWNDIGEEIGMKYLGLNNKLILDNTGVAEYKYTLGPTGLIRVIKRYDILGNLTNNSDGVAETYYTPNLNGLYFLEYEVDFLGNKLIEIDTASLE